MRCLFCALYVDDAILQLRLIHKFKTYLGAKFAMKVAYPGDAKQGARHSGAKPGKLCFRRAPEQSSRSSSLIYLVISTRPDLAYAVGTVAKYLDRPSAAHLQALKRIMRYNFEVLQRQQAGWLL
ncbi:uncharacterized protein LOC112351284 isoform X2 [Selaginella moellendorffii]|uniref:uncharacterized protein LOC112351284 isoform X2 n=1 Tax=Selaginella moellendorffii TaxID=88036 RepID=UPI000D1C6E0D|nr:uncharacterized protein LOC112351284 isoform X2 [Selaginella moellendorffii]|eukprot:XP_024544628.1 uncharacterized protein LOC112351284 isoform X2 [Selaginella moellendorffii]